MRWYLLGAVLVSAGYLVGPWVVAKIARRYSANEIEIKGYRYRFDKVPPAEVSPGFEDRYVECRRCRRMGVTAPRIKLQRFRRRA